MLQFSEPILDAGVRSVAVTLASEGALACWKEEGADTLVRKVDATPVSTVVDVTGCGDAFVAGFIVHFQKTHEFWGSYRFANTIAGLKCGFSGFDWEGQYKKSLLWPSKMR